LDAAQEGSVPRLAQFGSEPLSVGLAGKTAELYGPHAGRRLCRGRGHGRGRLRRLIRGGSLAFGRRLAGRLLRRLRARAAALLLLTLRGTPFLYAGEELGLEDALIPDARRVDPGGRDGCRAPIPWESAAPHGWAGAPAWLPWPPEPARRSAEAQRADGGSILHLYRRLLAARGASPALALGAFEWLPARDGVLAYRRRSGRDARTVLVNFSDEPRELALPDPLRIEIASDGAGEGGRFSGALAPSQALILK
jgi:alpha-glucosidase